MEAIIHRFIIFLIFLTPNVAFSLEGCNVYIFQHNPIQVVTYDLDGIEIANKKTNFINPKKLYYYQDKIYTFDEKHLIKINIEMNTKVVIPLGELLNNKNLVINNIISVDKTHIYFNLVRTNYRSLSEKLFFGYSYNENLKSFKPIGISNHLYEIISIANGKYYYNDLKTNIYEKCRTKSTRFKFKGKYPTVSTNGKYLAFYRNNFFWGTLYIYDLLGKKIILKIRTLAGLNSRIRWSQNSQYIAVNDGGSDISMSTTQVIDIVHRKTVLKFKPPAINWFLN